MNEDLYPVAREEYPVAIERSVDKVTNAVSSYEAWKAPTYQMSVPSSSYAPMPMPTFIPSEKSFFEYIVKAGDSLWKISQMYGTTIDAIKDITGLDSNYLKIGQKLKIPMHKER